MKKQSKKQQEKDKEHKLHVTSLWNRFTNEAGISEKIIILNEIKAYTEGHGLDSNGDALQAPPLKYSEELIKLTILSACRFYHFLNPFYKLFEWDQYFIDFHQVFARMMGFDFGIAETNFHNDICQGIYPSDSPELGESPEQSTERIFKRLNEIRESYFRRGLEEVDVCERYTLDILVGAITWECIVLKLQDELEITFPMGGLKDASEQAFLMWDIHSKIYGIPGDAGGEGFELFEREARWLGSQPFSIQRAMQAAERVQQFEFNRFKKGASNE